MPAKERVFTLLTGIPEDVSAVAKRADISRPSAQRILWELYGQQRIKRGRLKLNGSKHRVYVYWKD